MQSIHLMGSEDVAIAGGRMREAAADMQRASSQITDEMERMRTFMDDWILRLEGVISRSQGEE